MYNSLFSKNSIDNQLLKAQMDIAKLELQEDFSYNNLKSIITFSKYPLFYKLLQFSLTIPTGFVKFERSILVHCDKYLTTTEQQWDSID